MNLKLNQYQDLFHINNRSIIVDYFMGQLEDTGTKKAKEKVQEIYSKDYETYEKEYFDRINKSGQKDELTVVIVPYYECNMEFEYCY